MKVSLTKNAGFSLIELLVVITIIGILSSIIYVNFGNAGATGRDAKRQADLKMLQNAIEQYKAKYGKYPDQGCGAPASTFATEATCPNYVVGLVPEFLPRLPRDPRRGSAQGFAYITNDFPSNVGTVYKAAVLGSVESEIVTYAHPLRSCDMGFIDVASDPANLKCPGASPPASCPRQICGQVIFNNNNTPPQCVDTNTQFQTSYAVWGGYAKRTSPSTVLTAPNGMLDLTQRVICR